MVGGMFFKKADATLVADLEAARPAVPPRAVRALLPALLALPHAADLLRAAVLVHPHHRDQGRAARARTRAPPGSRTPSSGAATATGWRTTSTGPCRATATGARRCRSGAAPRTTSPCVGSLAELGDLAGTDLSELDPHRPYVDDVTFACPQCGATATPRAGGHRRLVRLRRDAVRPVGLPAHGRGDVRAQVPGRLHLRGDRPDPRLVLHADGGRHAGLRPVVLPERALPGPHPRRGRPQDEQAPGQRPRADPADGRPRRRRRALVHAGRRLALAGAPGRPRRDRRGRAQDAADLLEHRVVPVALRAHRRVRARRGTQPPRSRTARSWTGGRWPRPAAWPREVDRRPRRLRHPARRPTAGRLRRRPVQLVRAALAAAVLGRRPRRAAHAARVPADRDPADGAVHAVHHRAGVAGPLRRPGGARLGAPAGLAGRLRRACRPRARRAGGPGPPTGGAGPRRACGGQGAHAPAPGARPRVGPRLGPDARRAARPAGRGAERGLGGQPRRGHRGRHDRRARRMSA